MKKNKLLISLACLTPVIGTLPLFATSCGKYKPNKYAEEIYKQCIKEFVGDDWKGGICSIPHPFFNLDAIRNYLTNRITSFGYSVERDDYGNIWFDIPATKGWQKVKPLILQAHMDMVWSIDENNPPAVDHPTPILDTKPDGKQTIHTEGYKSSLGADNGQGLAIILSIAQNKNINHGPLRCIITADEEPGLVGAGELGKKAAGNVNVIDHSKGFDYLLNLDNETIGQMCTATAGGYSCRYTTSSFATEDASSLYQYTLEVKNGLGGHSGLAMKENHMNAVKEVAKALLTPVNSLDAHLISIDSYESAANIVPGHTTFVFGLTTPIPTGFAEKIVNDIKTAHPIEQNVTCTITEITHSKYSHCLSEGDSSSVLKLIDDSHYGADKWKPDHSDLASSSNLCPVTLDASNSTEAFSAEIYSRSDYEQDLQKYKTDSDRFFDEYNSVVPSNNKQIANYPPYVALANDKIMNKAIDIFKKQKVDYFFVAPHAGSEVSWFAKQNPYLTKQWLGLILLTVIYQQKN